MEKAKGMKITVKRDGPYEVSGGAKLTDAIIGADDRGNSMDWVEGKEYPAKEKYCLCRCGHSANKPMCDGAHKTAGFVGREHADRPTYKENAKLQKGERVDLLDDESLCVGARFCDVGDSVWNYVRNSDTPENAGMAVLEACRCPAGRLTVVDRDGTMIEPPLEPSISTVQDPVANCRGPLWVKGGIEVENENGEKYEVRNRVTLCRCGQSENQPYCDGAHYHCKEMQGMDE